MIKVILTAITIILVGLVVYNYTSTNKESKVIPVEKVPVQKVIVTDSKKIIAQTKKEVVVPKPSLKAVRAPTVDMSTEDDTGMSGEASLESSESEPLEVDEETPEHILEIEEASGLTDLSDEDNTPMETEKMVF